MRLRLFSLAILGVACLMGCTPSSTPPMKASEGAKAKKADKSDEQVRVTIT